MKNKSTKVDWDKYWKSNDHQPVVMHEELLQQIIKHYSLTGGSIINKKVLEVGAGMGGDSIFLAKKGAEVTVLDFSPDALELVKKNAEKNKVTLKLIEADALHIPFKEETFDVIFHQGFLEHFKNPKDYLLEQKRILKTGGYLIVDVPQKFTTYTIKKHLAMKKGKWFAGWETEYSPIGLEKIIKACGFKVIDMYGWGYYGQIKKIEGFIGKLPIKLWFNWCIGCVAQKI